MDFYLRLIKILTDNFDFSKNYSKKLHEEII